MNSCLMTFLISFSSAPCSESRFIRYLGLNGIPWGQAASQRSPLRLILCISHPPADDLPREQVQHNRQVQPTFSCGQIGDVCRPFLVRLGRSEVALLLGGLEFAFQALDFGFLLGEGRDPASRKAGFTCVIVFGLLSNPTMNQVGGIPKSRAALEAVWPSC